MKREMRKKTVSKSKKRFTIFDDNYWHLSKYLSYRYYLSHKLHMYTIRIVWSAISGFELLESLKAITNDSESYNKLIDHD